MDYDTSGGIDQEITLFSDKVSMPLGDKRLRMNQKVIFNKLRATVSGGITIQSL